MSLGQQIPKMIFHLFSGYNHNLSFIVHFLEDTPREKWNLKMLDSHSRQVFRYAYQWIIQVFVSDNQIFFSIQIFFFQHNDNSREPINILQVIASIRYKLIDISIMMKLFIQLIQ